jgi:hypothetical protein
MLANSRVHALLTRLFGAPEEINGAHRCPTYLYRWTVLKRGDRGVYIHRFVGDDWSRDLHDHPKRFISIGLWGAYIEETPLEMFGAGNDHFQMLTHERVYRAPWIRTFPATHIHRLRLVRVCDCHHVEEAHSVFGNEECFECSCINPVYVARECWTLVIVLKAVRPWGFWHLGKFIPWRRYVNSATADARKACP